MLVFIGDIFVLIVSLWLTLFIRYRELPKKDIFFQHLDAFVFLFLIWVLVFFIAGLYEKRMLIIKRKLFSNILNVQIINSIVAAVFFYFLPIFGITPKTNLFIYLVVSLVLIIIWRAYTVPFLGVRKRVNAVIIGDREEMAEIRDAIKNNHWYNLNLISSINLDNISSLDIKQDILNMIYTENVSVIIVDLESEKVKPLMPHLYNLMFSGIRFMNAHDVYEEIFGRIPLTLIQYDWFLENISNSSHVFYDALKRLMDIVTAFVLGIVSLIFYPFVYIAIKMEDGGPIFYTHERIGMGGRRIKI